MFNYDYGVVIQARMGSTRRPGKIAYSVCGHTLLEYQIKRLQVAGIDNIFVATTDLEADDLTEQITLKAGCKCFRGSENDVLLRYVKCAEHFKIKNIIRLGGDDPLADPLCIIKLIETQKNLKTDFVFASHKYGWIYGTAAELIAYQALKKASEKALSPSDREHVVTYIRNCSDFSRIKISPDDKTLIRPDIYVSIDYPEDLSLVSQILEFFAPKNRLFNFTQKELVELFDSGILEITNKNLHHGFEE